MPRVLPLILASALLVPLFALAPSGAESPPPVPCTDPRGCPDLIVDGTTFKPFVMKQTFQSRHCAVQEGMVVAGQRTLLKFNFTTPNLGPGDLIVGSPDLHPEWFEEGTCHGHFHFREYADYRLWTPAQFDAWQALRASEPDAIARDLLAAHPELEPVRGDKRGFCVIDVLASGIGVPKYFLCDFQGISVGWADEYHFALDGQWIDVTGVPGGAYVLEAEVNAERLYQEASYANNRAWRDVTI